METVYGYYIFHTLRRFPHEWIDLPFHEKAVIFAYIDEKNKEDRMQRAKMEAQRKSSGSPRRKIPARVKRR